MIKADILFILFENNWGLHILFLNKCSKSTENNFDIQPERIVLSIIDIHLLALISRKLARIPPFLYLPQPGQPCGSDEPLHAAIFREQLRFVQGQWTVPHNRHISLEDVDELRKLVNTVFANKLPHPGYPGIFLDFDKCIVSFLPFLSNKLFLGNDIIIIHQDRLIGQINRLWIQSLIN